MKKPSIAFSICALLLAAVCARAETYYFDIESFIADTQDGQQVNLSDTIWSDGGETKSYWYSDSSFTSAVTDATFSFLDNAENSVVVGGGTAATVSTLTQGRSLVIDGDFKVNLGSLESTGTGTHNGATGLAFFKGATADNTIRIGSYVGGSNSESLGFGGSGTALYIGEITLRAINLGCAHDPLNYLEIGTVNLGVANNNKASYFAAAGEGRNAENPDVKIGSLTSNLSATSASTILAYGESSFWPDATPTIATDSYVQISSITGTAGIGMGPSNVDSTGSVTYVLTNSANAATSGSIAQFANTSTTSLNADWMTTNGAKVHLLMSSRAPDGSFSNATQSFTGDYMVISGNVTIQSGKLLINYGAVGNDMSKGSLIFDKAASAPIASFGSSADIGSTYQFSDIRVDGGGEIVVRVESRDNFDRIALSSGGISGSGTLVVDFDTTAESELYELVVEDISQGLQIISWTSGNSCTATIEGAVKSFKYAVDGEEIEYVFASMATDTGLLVGYVAVPEPAEWAAALGLGAILLALWRRRK